jgi:hypothetical protein
MHSIKKEYNNMTMNKTRKNVLELLQIVLDGVRQELCVSGTARAATKNVLRQRGNFVRNAIGNIRAGAHT